MAEAVTHQLPFYRNGNTTGDLSHTSSAQIFILFKNFLKEDKKNMSPTPFPHMCSELANATFRRAGSRLAWNRGLAALTPRPPYAGSHSGSHGSLPQRDKASTTLQGHILTTAHHFLSESLTSWSAGSPDPKLSPPPFRNTLTGMIWSIISTAFASSHVLQKTVSPGSTNTLSRWVHAVSTWRLRVLG